MNQFPAPGVTIIRDILGKGLLKLSDEERKYGFLRLYCLVTQDDTDYRNLKYPVPHKGFYGYVECIANERVLHSVPIEFAGQLLYSEEKHSAQIRLANLDIAYISLTQVRSWLASTHSTGELVPTPEPSFVFEKLVVDQFRVKTAPRCQVRLIALLDPYVASLLEDASWIESPDRDDPDAYTPPDQVPSPSAPYVPPDDGGNTDIPPVVPDDPAEDGTWSFYIYQMPYGSALGPLSVQGKRRDKPTLTETLPPGSTPGNCPAAPCVYLVSEYDGRNMYGTSNFNQSTGGIYLHTFEFTPSS